MKSHNVFPMLPKCGVDWAFCLFFTTHALIASCASVPIQKAPAQLDDYAGTCRVDASRILTGDLFDELDDKLLFFDLEDMDPSGDCGGVLHSSGRTGSRQVCRTAHPYRHVQNLNFCGTLMTPVASRDRSSSRHHQCRGDRGSFRARQMFTRAVLDSMRA